MKRSAKRSIYIQVLLFSMSGIYTLFKDGRRQELMIFATGHTYRETGTASKDVGSTKTWSGASTRGQRGTGTFALLAMICWFVGQLIGTIVFGALLLPWFGILFYKNVSFVIAKRLLREPNVVMILVLVLCNWVINIVRPRIVASPVTGLIYVLVASMFVFLDA